MASTLIINSSHQISQGRYRYVFPSSVQFSEGDTVSMQSLSMYNSMQNIESIAGNNRVTLLWHANTTTTVNMVIADGFYTIDQLSQEIQKQSILNDLYCIDSTGSYVFFTRLTTNSVRYAAQLTVAPLPTAAQATTLGWTKPPGAAWSFPATAKTPQLTIPSVEFGKLIGFLPGTYPATVQTTLQDFLSTQVPQISTVSSILIGTNLVNTPFANPNTLFASVAINADFGGLIVHESMSPIPTAIAPGIYQSIDINFYTQAFESLRMLDPEIVLTLSIVRRQK